MEEIMKKVKQNTKRFLSMMLAVMMLCTSPMSVLAEDLPADNVVVTEVQDELLSGTEGTTTEEAVETPVEAPAEVPEQSTTENTENVEETETTEATEASAEETAEAAEVKTYANGLPSTIAAGETFTLEQDYVMESGQWFEKIEGTLDGNGHTITLTDKPLANVVTETGVIQNLGVTSENVIDYNGTFGSMAVTFSGTIQNCYSTAKIKLTAIFGEVAGIAGTANGGLVQNSYFAGTVKGALSGYGGFIAVNNSETTNVKNCCYEETANNVAAPAWGNKPVLAENVEKKSLNDFKSGAVNDILNTDIPDLGFSWALPEDGSNQGFPILVKGGTDIPETVDKSVLEVLIGECGSINAEGYTAESWNVFAEALKQANDVFANPDATKKDVDEAIEKLQLAKDGLKKEKPTTPVAPPEDASKIIHIKTDKDLKGIKASEGQYYVLDNDIQLGKIYFSTVDFKGVLDGKGHTITFNNNSWLFQHLSEEGVLQNIHFTGTIVQNDQTGNGPVGQNFYGSIINCYSDIKAGTGSTAFSFAKHMKGGNIVNSVSLSTDVKDPLVGEYTNGKVKNSYWLSSSANTCVPQEALIDSFSKTEEEMKSKDFVALLNANRGEHGTIWGQSSNGYPYFGEDQDYNPDKPDFPANENTVVFEFKNGTKEEIVNQTLEISLDEVDASHIAGNFKIEDLDKNDRVSWELQDVKPANCMLIGADQGMLSVDAKGTANVKATVTKANGEQKASWVKVIVTEKKLEAIKLYVDNKEVTGKNTIVQGSEEKKIEVKARYEGEKEFVPASSTRFEYKAEDTDLIKQLAGSSVFQFRRPGTASITVTSKINSTVKATAEFTSKYVPVDSVKPAVSGEEIIHGRNANDPDHYAFLPNITGVIVSPINASYADNWTVSSSNPEIAEYIGSMVKGYVPYQAGTVTYTAKIKQVDPNTKKESEITGTSQVTYKYQNPLTRVILENSKINMKSFTEQLLDLKFDGELSDQKWSVTYPEMSWSYDKEGIVKVFKKETGFWKKDNVEWEGAPDYGSFVTSDKYYVEALNEGTVTVTGTPLDKTNKIEPIKFTVEVSAGDTPTVNIDELVEKGLNGAKAHMDSLAPVHGYKYPDADWYIYNALRAKDTISEDKLETYYQSVVNDVNKWEPNKKPTDIARTAIVLSIMNMDITKVGNKNLAEMLYNHPNLSSGSNELSWALLALDAKKTEIPSGVTWSREKIIDELLTFQNPKDGGFGLNNNTESGVDTTAMALQALAPYRAENERVNKAIEDGLSYLKGSLSDTYDTGTSEGTAQLLLTLTVLKEDPLSPEYGKSHKNIITGLMDYYVETESGKGFRHDKSNNKLNNMSSLQSYQALTAYVQYKNGEKTYWDLTETEAPEETPSQTDLLVQKGMKTAEAYLRKTNENGFEYGDEWTVHALLRAGGKIDETILNQYYDSIVQNMPKVVEGKVATDYERIAIALQIMGKDIRDVGGHNLEELIYNNEPLDKQVMNLAWALITLDMKDTQIPEGGQWKRNKIISALKQYQNAENGGFCVSADWGASVDATCMVLQALEPYKESNAEAKDMIEKAFQYLKNEWNGNRSSFLSSENYSQYILTLTTYKIDPLNSEYGTLEDNAISYLMNNYFLEEGFFSNSYNKKINQKSNEQAYEALTSYVQYKNGEETYWKLPSMEKPDPEPEKPEPEKPEPPTPEKPVEVGTIKLTIMDGILKDQVRLVPVMDNKNASLTLFGKEAFENMQSKLLSKEAVIPTKGMILNEEVTIYSNDTASSILQRVCKEKGIELKLRDLENYIEALDGLSEFSRGAESGWKYSVDGVFPTFGIKDCSVADGDIKNGSLITVEYTNEGYGKDLEENADLKSLDITGGKLVEEFKRDQYEYHIEATEDLIFTPQMYNRYSLVTIEADGKLYDPGDKIPLKDGDVLTFTSKKNVRGEDVKTYKFAVKDVLAHDKPIEKPEDPEKITQLVDKKYGIAVEGEDLVEGVELKVKKLGKDDEDVKRMRKEIPSSKSLYRRFDVKLVKDGNELELTNPLTISIPVGKKYDGDTLTVLHCMSDKVEKLTGKVEHGIITFQTNSLSSFGVVVDTVKLADNANTNGGPNGNGGGKPAAGGARPTGSAAAKTGDTAQSTVWMTMLLLSAGVILLASKRRKEK